MAFYTHYTKVPREIIDSKTLSARAKVIYEYFLTLFELSKKHSDQFQDERGIYICCPREKLMDKFACAKGTVIKAIRELKINGFIEEVRQGQGKVNKIYMKDLFLGSERSKKETSKSSKSRPSESTKIELQEVQKMTPNTTNLLNTININNNNNTTTTQYNNNQTSNVCCSANDNPWCDPYYHQIVKRLEKYDLSKALLNYETFTSEDREFISNQLKRYFKDKTTENLDIWFAHYMHFMEWGLIWLACSDIEREHEGWKEAKILLDALLDMGIDTLNKWRRYIGVPEVKENETLLERVSRMFTEHFNKKPNRVITEHLKYFLNCSMECDVIVDSFNIALSKNKEWDYAQGILNNRLKKGIITIEDVANDDLHRLI